MPPHAARQCGLCTGCYSNHSVLTATTAQALRVAPRLLPQQPTHNGPQPPATARGRAVFASPPRGYGGRSPPAPGGAGGRPPAGQERVGRSRNPALKRTSDGNHRIRTRRQRRRPGRRPARGIPRRDSPMRSEVPSREADQQRQPTGNVPGAAGAVPGAARRGGYGGGTPPCLGHRGGHPPGGEYCSRDNRWGRVTTGSNLLR